ncbi:MAG: transglutaminase domain-containing protein, partial [Oscillospiraceae bacterium]|nr:transglutaminase domain-containing protein [Oscillospiraceae bacterium]
SREEELNAPFFITSSQTVTAASSLRMDDAYSLYYLDYNLTAGEWDAALDLSYRGFVPGSGSGPLAWMSSAYGISVSELSRNAHERYLQLPNSLPARVYSLALEITRGLSTPHQKARAIERYLSTTYPYATNVPETPPDVDFTDYFLFDLQRGYCTYYATAMAVLCRAAGIPARYAEGFAFAPDPIGEYYYASGAQAHAWTEVYLDGFGWIAYEPTAGFGENFEASYRDGEPAFVSVETPAPPVTLPPTPPPPTPDALQTAAPTPVPTAAPEPAAWDRFLEAMRVAGGLLLRWSWAAALLLWLVFNRIRYRNFRLWLRRATYGKTGMRRVYRRAVRMLALVKLEPKPSETPRETAVRVSQVIHDDGSLLRLAEAYGYAVYGEQFPEPGDRRAAFIALSAIEEYVRRRRWTAFRLWLLRYGLGIV